MFAHPNSYLVHLKIIAYFFATKDRISILQLLPDFYKIRNCNTDHKFSQSDILIRLGDLRMNMHNLRAKDPDAGMFF